MKKTGALLLLYLYARARDIPPAVILVVMTAGALLLTWMSKPRPRRTVPRPPRLDPPPLPAPTRPPEYIPSPKTTGDAITLLKEIERRRARLYKLYDKRDRADYLHTDPRSKTYRGLEYDIKCAERDLKRAITAAGLSDDYGDDEEIR